VQFTWRMTGKPKREARGATREEPKSGTEYLRRAARAANPAPPPAFRALRTPLTPLVVLQRYQPGTAILPEAVYHLVERKNVDRYAAAAAALKTSSPLLSVTGPFPPFAFAPDIL